MMMIVVLMMMMMTIIEMSMMILYVALITSLLLHVTIAIKDIRAVRVSFEGVPSKRRRWLVTIIYHISYRSI